MKRSAYFDNARLILIFLVVFGHMIQPFTDGSKAINTLYMWIYTFHMPAFIFLAGFFAKGSGSAGYIVKLVRKLLVPYFIFQLIYSGYYFLFGDDGWQGMFYPHWSLWFLFSLFSWHMLLLWFKRLPAFLSVITAVQIGIIVGYFGEIGHTFSLSRTFVFFPFFLAGFWLKKEHIMFLKHRSVQLISLAIMIVAAWAVYISPDFNSGWLLASKSYSDLGLPDFGGIARLLVYITSGLMAMSFLAWIPVRHNRLTYIGRRTLYVYLLHGFFIQFFRETDLFEINSIMDFLGLAVIAAMIVLILSSKPVLGVWQPFIEAKITIMRQTLTQITRKTQSNHT